jgi:hypothetical protein
VWSPIQPPYWRIIQYGHSCCPCLETVFSVSNCLLLYNEINAWVVNKVSNTVLFGPPLWSSDQSSWLQIRRSGFDSRHYQIFWDVVGLERGPLSLVSTTEELLERKSSGSSLENQEYSSRDLLRWPRGTLYPQKLALTLPKSGGRSVGIVHSRTQTTEFSLIQFYLL